MKDGTKAIDQDPVSAWLFPSKYSVHGHLSRQQANNILSKTFKALRLSGASTHSMRRTMLVTMARTGVALRVMKQISGHTNIAQLEDYVDPDVNLKQRAVYSLEY